MNKDTASSTDPAVSCANCQACCCHLDAMLFNDHQIPDGLTTTNQRGDRSMLRLADGWCVALDRKTMRCRIYQQRPWICREFEMGEADCLEARAAYPLTAAVAISSRRLSDNEDPAR